jgi:hypothetical protein
MLSPAHYQTSPCLTEPNARLSHRQPSSWPRQPIPRPARAAQLMASSAQGQAGPLLSQLMATPANVQHSQRSAQPMHSPDHRVESIERPELVSPYPGQHMETSAHYHPSPCLTQPIARLSHRQPSSWPRQPIPRPAQGNSRHLPTSHKWAR